MDKIIFNYQARVWIIMGTCLVDIVLNGWADNTSYTPEESFMPYLFVGFQIAIQVVNVLLVFMLFSGTYLFTVGLLDLQLREFKFHLAGIFAYLGLYLAYGGTKLVSWVKLALHTQGSHAFYFFSFFCLFTHSHTRTHLRVLPSPPWAAVLSPPVWRGEDLGPPRVCDRVHPSKTGLHAVLHAHAHHLRPHGGHHLVQQGPLDSQV